MSRITDLINGKSIDRCPIWFMRQAGRYLPEYMEIRKNKSDFLNLCYDYELASKITLQPIERFKEIDAAIIFSDILVIPDSLSINVKFIKNEGPLIEKFKENDLIKIEKIIKNRKFLDKLTPVFKNIKLTRKNLSKEKSLIGFSGSPFTLACYMIDSNSKSNFSETRVFCKNNKDIFLNLLSLLSVAVENYLISQIESGVDMIMLFESWASVANDDEFDEFVINFNKKIIDNIRSKYKDIIISFFPRLSGSKYYNIAKYIDCNILSIDQNIDKKWVKNNIQSKFNKIIQGSLDNYLLLSNNYKLIENNILNIIDHFHKNGLIFNLGHGIIKTTNINNVKFTFDVINKYFGINLLT